MARRTRRRRRWILSAPGMRLASASVIAIALALPTNAGGGAQSPTHAYISVAVATVWVSPTSPRPIDQPALRNPVDLRRWTNALNTRARRGLVGRIETQALYGEGVRILERRGAWAHIAVIDQPTPRDPRGYPGWVPTAQLASGFGKPIGSETAVVVRRMATLRGVSPPIQLSYGTRLSFVGASGANVLVRTPDAQTARLSRTAVSIRGVREEATRATGRRIAAAARLFVGVRYLWGGTSAYGFDCSGLAELVFRSAGLVIPRDADAQARAGERVAFRKSRRATCSSTDGNTSTTSRFMSAVAR